MDSNPQPKRSTKVNVSRPLSGKSGNVSGSDNEEARPSKYSKAGGDKIKKSVTITEQKSKYGMMPQTMHDKDEDISGIDIDQMTLDELRDNFIKFLPEDAPGKLGDRLDPEYMKR